MPFLVPKVDFAPITETEPLFSQTGNMRKKWSEIEDRAFYSINNLVNIRWQIDYVLVQTEQLLQRPKLDAYLCEGEVDAAEPSIIHLRMGKKVNGGGSKALKYLFHEVIHSLVMSTKRSRFFRKAGELEDWLFDELATDYLAQQVAKEVLGTQVHTPESLDYALTEVGRQIMRQSDIRERIVKRIEQRFKEYDRSQARNFYSFRRTLMTI